MKYADRISEILNAFSPAPLRADQIKTGGKHPIIIFEDLDKLNPEDAWTVF